MVLQAKRWRDRHGWNEPEVESGWRNLGWLVYRERGERRARVLGADLLSSPTHHPATFRWENVRPAVGRRGAATHEAPILLSRLRSRARGQSPECQFRILQIFTERSPCGICQILLTHQLGPYNNDRSDRLYTPNPIPVTYLVPHGMGSSRQLMLTYRRWFGAP
jgi:hypothetical protein